MNESVLHKVVVGSRLHNLHNETSDYDYRAIFVHPIGDLISPFKTIKNTAWIEGDEDNTAYELREFCKVATKGNPTILEILYSNMVIETTPWGQELVENKHKFLDSERIFHAFKGYAHNQYKKMNLFEPDARTPKFAVAYLRSLIQGAELLESGELTNQITEQRDFLLEVKYNWDSKLIPELSRQFELWQVKLADTYAKNHDKFKPDIPWIENFVYRVYIAHI